MNSPQTRTSARRLADADHRWEAGASQFARTELACAVSLSIANGPAAAAILAAGIGCFFLGVFSLGGDASQALARFFIFYTPTGPLSGVTTSAIVIWLLSWFGLSRRWRGKSVALGRVTAAAFMLLAMSVLLTFPPFMDLLQGK